MYSSEAFIAEAVRSFFQVDHFKLFEIQRAAVIAVSQLHVNVTSSMVNIKILFVFDAVLGE